LVDLINPTIYGHVMKLHRSITEPIREGAKWDERWNAADSGLIACWEQGRERRLEDPSLAVRAANGQLVVLPWKGGVQKATKKKCGTLYYLAMWQGLRDEDLDIDTSDEIVLNCTASGMTVVFSGDKTE
jgi:hypothetical protein